jgi:hypothetical protein
VSDSAPINCSSGVTRTARSLPYFPPLRYTTYSMEAVLELIQECKCPICLEFFTNPRNSPCQHNFCEACIYQHIKGKHNTCPTCRFPGVNKRSLEKNDTLENVTKIVQKLTVAMGIFKSTGAGSGPSPALITADESSRCRPQYSPEEYQGIEDIEVDNDSRLHFEYRPLPEQNTNPIRQKYNTAVCHKNCDTADEGCRDSSCIVSATNPATEPTPVIDHEYQALHPSGAQLIYPVNGC